MTEAAPNATMRKRSQGNLRPSEQETQGSRRRTSAPEEAQSATNRGGRRWSVLLSSAAGFGCLTLLVAGFLFRPYLESLSTPIVSEGAKEQQSSVHKESLDHRLQPDQHAVREPTTLRFDWYITSGARRPDGVLKTVYLINDEFLGPTIECRSGDRLVIRVENGLVDEDIAIHWHGLQMLQQNEQDGAVGYTQDGTRPGDSFTYNFTISEDQFGTFWYHAHDGVQRADGLFGALIVHRPTGAGETDAGRYAYDEERLLIIGDWYHRTAEQVLAWYMRAASFGNEPVPDSMLLNGIGAYNCSMAVPARPVDCTESIPPELSFDASKTYRLRVINAGSLGGFTLTAPTLSITAIEIDGGNPIKGRATRSIGIIYPGQRTDLIISVIDVEESVPTLQLELDRQNFKYPNPALIGKQHFPLQFSGMIKQTATGIAQQYDLADTTSTGDIKPDFGETANLTLVLYSTSVKLAHLGNKPHGFLNQTTWKPQSPFLRAQPRDQWDEHQFVPELPRVDGDANFWIDIILNNLDDGSHPFHMHGYDLWVLQTHAGFGWGSWNPFEKPEPPGGPLNKQNPIKRDTVIVPKRGYTVLRFKPDNPGIWMFHCHILWHQASGMAMGLQVI